MEKLLEALKVLMGHSDRAEVAKLMKDHAQPIHHEIHQDGFNGGYGKGKGEFDAEKAKVTASEAKVTKLEADLVEARKANPEVAKIHEDYQAQLRKKDQDHAAALTAATALVKTKEQNRAKAELVAKLRKLGVRQAMAEVEAERHVSRLVADDAGELTVLQPGLTIPFAQAGDKSPLDLLADAIRKGVPADMIESKGDGGSGDKASGVAAIVEQTRKDAQAAREAENQRREQQTGPGGIPNSLAGMAR